MDTSWLEYCATEEQLKAFNDTGYLVVEDAISPEMVDALEAVADRLDAEERAKTGLEPHKMLSKFRTLSSKTIYCWNCLITRKYFHCFGISLAGTSSFTSPTSSCILPNPPISRRFAKAHIGTKTAVDLCRRWNVHTRDSH